MSTSPTATATTDQSHPAPRQLEQARDLGHRMAQAAAARTERKVDALWVETALTLLAAWVRNIPDRVNEEFTMEMARRGIAGRLAEPTDLRAWGHVTKAAVKRKIITPTGRAAPAISSHGTLKPTYTGGPGAA